MLQGPSYRKRLLKPFGNVVIQLPRNLKLSFEDCIGLMSLKFILQGFNFVKLILAKSVFELTFNMVDDEAMQENKVRFELCSLK